jgi:hypothetical protein
LSFIAAHFSCGLDYHPPTHPKDSEFVVTADSLAIATRKSAPTHSLPLPSNSRRFFWTSLVFFLCVQRQLIWDTQRTPHSHRDLWRPNQGPRLSILLGTTPLVDTLITFWTLDILFEELDFGCHPTSNSQHICNHNFYLLNLQQPRLCTHLEDTHPPLFPEFQLMKPIF